MEAPDQRGRVVIELPYSEPAYTIQITLWELGLIALVFLAGAILINRAIVHFFPGYSRRNRH